MKEKRRMAFLFTQKWSRIKNDPGPFLLRGQDEHPSGYLKKLKFSFKIEA